MKAVSPHLSFKARFVRFCYSRGGRIEHRGLEIRHNWLSAEEAALALSKIASAMDCLASVSPKHFARLQGHVRGILVLATPGACAQWIDDLGLIVVDYGYISDATVSEVNVASTLVHESTHAWLMACGIGYEDGIRERVERVCVRAELAFARRMNGTEDLVTELAERLTLDPYHYTRTAQIEREAEVLRDSGFPRAFVRAFRFIAHRYHQRLR